MKSPNYNMIGCPHCSNPLIDYLPQYEFKQEVKTVKCNCCDYLGMRRGFMLLSLEEQNEYKKNLKPIIKTYEPTTISVNA